MIIPVCVDDKKDEGLIKWLGEKNNRSAFIRFVLYEKMSEIQGNNKEKSRKINDISEKIDDNFMNCIEKLG